MAGQFAVYPSLQERIILITGGADGIGASIVEAFVRQGSRVFFFDIADEKALDLVERLKRDPKHITPTYHHCDLTNTQDLRDAVQRILKSCPKIDVLVNNAANDERKPTADITPEFFDASVAVNFRQVFFATQSVIPIMQQAKAGNIINIGSISWAIPATGLPIYTACKSAIVGLTRTHAHEFGKDGIRVNSIMPGGISTERQKREVYTPEYQEWIMSHQALKIELVPDDVARLALFLAADDSRAITGQSYIVDGGWI